MGTKSQPHDGDVKSDLPLLDAAVASGSAQGPSDVGPQSFSQRPEVEEAENEQHGLTETFDVIVPGQQPTCFGDMIIITTGPVYNGPVLVQYPQHSNHDPSSEEPSISERTNAFVDENGETEPKLPTHSQGYTPEPASTCRNEAIRDSSCDITELQDALKARVRELASEESSLADFSRNPISTVNLAIISNPHQIEDQFLAERGVAEKTYERHATSDITPQEMFDRAKQRAQTEADEKFAQGQETAKEGYVERYGNTVGVLGQAGIGKTTLSKSWALQALSGQLVGRVTFFFYIVVRFIDFGKEVTLCEFLFSAMLPYLDHKFRKNSEEIINLVISDPDVLLIVDGLDEAAFESFATEVPQISLHTTNKPEVYLKHLLGGKLLPRARKIFTSRPLQFYNLHSSHRPRFVVQILGLTPNSQRELGRQICGAEYKKIHAKLSENSALFAYCYVPVNFILTVHYLMSYDGDIQFASLSRVLAFTCVQYSRTVHVKGKQCELDKLAKLAWDGFVRKKVVFHWDDFTKADIGESTADAFLNTSITKRENFKLTILDGQKRRYFSHLIWQEFFAAVYFMMFMSVQEWKEQLAQLSDDRWEVVSKFAFGICDLEVFDELDAALMGHSRKAWRAKKKLLSKFVSSTANKGSRERIFRVCGLAHEANDEEMTSSVSTSLPGAIDLSNPPQGSSLHLTALENLTFVLQARRTKRLKVLNLRGNSIRDSGAALVVNCIHNIRKVDLGKCEVEDRGVEILSEKIKDLLKPLKALSIGSNLIGNSGAVFLGNCIHNIQKVDLSGCNIKDEGAKTLAKKIKDLQMPMKYLDLSYNDLTDGCAEALASCAPNIKLFRVCFCDFTQAGKDLIRSKARGELKMN